MCCALLAGSPRVSRWGGVESRWSPDGGKNSDQRLDDQRGGGSESELELELESEKLQRYQSFAKSIESRIRLLIQYSN
jgi:hypothetical protein